MSTILENPEVKVVSTEDLLNGKIRDLQEANFNLKHELDTLRMTDPVQIAYRLQYKIQRQASALNALNRRVRTQRLILRKLNELGRDLTIEEWTELKAQNADHFEGHSNMYI